MSISAARFSHLRGVLVVHAHWRDGSPVEAGKALAHRLCCNTSWKAQMASFCTGFRSSCRRTTMTNRWFILRLAGMAVLLLLAVAGTVFAQQDGPLPPGPAAQAPEQSTPVQNPSATSQPPAGSQTSAAPAAPTNTLAPGAIPTNAKVEIPGGTHIPLVLHNAISTRSARPGDPVYF